MEKEKEFWQKGGSHPKSSMILSKYLSEHHLLKHSPKNYLFRTNDGGISLQKSTKKQSSAKKKNLK